MNVIWTILAGTALFYLCSVVVRGLALKYSRALEIQFLYYVMALSSYKNHMQYMLKVVYEKNAETAPEVIKEYTEVIALIELRHKEMIESYIKVINEQSIFKTSVKSADEAAKYFEKHIMEKK